MINWRVRILNFILRRFFYLLYNPLAWIYDLVAALVSLGMWKDWVLTPQSYLTGPIILELGHGTGYLQRALLSKFSHANVPAGKVFKIFGLDASTQMGLVTIRRLKKGNLPYRLVRARSQSIPFPTGYFDQVIATFPSEYIFAEDTISEIARVLKPAGWAVILPQAQITGKKWLQRLAAWLFRITGQAVEADKIWRTFVQQPFYLAGFETNTEEIFLPASKIQVILAKKAKI